MGGAHARLLATESGGWVRRGGVLVKNGLKMIKKPICKKVLICIHIGSLRDEQTSGGEGVLAVMLCCTDGNSAELQPVEGVSRTPVESSRDDAFHCNWVRVQSCSPAGGKLVDVEL